MVVLGGWRYTSNPKHQQHVNERHGGGGLAVSEGRQRAIYKDEAVALAGWALVDAQFPWQEQGFIPDFGLARAVGIECYCVLFEEYRLVPRVLVAVMHRGQQRLSVADFLGARWHSSRQTSDETTENRLLVSRSSLKFPSPPRDASDGLATQFSQD